MNWAHLLRESKNAVYSIQVSGMTSARERITAYLIPFTAGGKWDHRNIGQLQLIGCELFKVNCGNNY